MREQTYSLTILWDDKTVTEFVDLTYKKAMTTARQANTYKVVNKIVIATKKSDDKNQITMEEIK